MKNWSLIVMTLLAMPAVALAQTENAPPPPPSFLVNLIFTLLPILLIGAFIWIFFIRNIRKIQSTQIEGYKKHHEKIEQLLERIAKALEKRNEDAS